MIRNKGRSLKLKARSARDMSYFQIRKIRAKSNKFRMYLIQILITRSKKTFLEKYKMTICFHKDELIKTILNQG